MTCSMACSMCVCVCVCLCVCVQHHEEGALMMQVLLRQHSVVVGTDGYTDDLARSTLEILMGEEE